MIMIIVHCQNIHKNKNNIFAIYLENKKTILTNKKLKITKLINACKNVRE